MIDERFSVFLIIVLFPSLILCNCPQIEPIEDFDIAKFSGHWYEIAKSDVSFDSGFKCTSLNFTMESAETLTMNVRLLHRNNKVKVEEYSIKYLKPSMFKMTFLSGLELPTQIIKVDYDSHALLFTCAKLFEIVAYEYASIISRTPTLSSEIIDDLYKTLNQTGLDTSKMVLEDQINCN